MSAAPVVQAVPEPSAAPRSAPVAKAATRSAPRQTARAAIPVATAPFAARAAAPSAVTPNAETVPVAVPAEAPQPVAAPTDDNTAAIGLGLLGLVALGGAGAYAATRRRRRVGEAELAYRDEPIAAIAPVKSESTPLRTTTAPAWVPAVATSASAPLMFERHPAPAQVAATAEGSMIPPGPLPTGPALAELFERMATAAPDAENPFNSTKRRRQRVRWLMKQHEYRLREADSKFDFRHYTTGTKSAEHEGARREFVPA